MATTPRTLTSRAAEALRRALIAGLAVASAAPAWADCHGLQLHAHRGAPGLPENSASAVRKALAGDFDGVEIDIQELHDQRWVLHHDLQVGRTTSLAGRRVADLDSRMWREVKLKDRNGRLVNEAPPFLADLARELPDTEGKVLNIEIKQTSGDCGPARRAATGLFMDRPSGRWFLTAIDRRQLQCVRALDTRGYLGQIVLDPASLAAEDNRTNRYAPRLPPTVIDAAWLRRLLQEVAPPVGIHVDVSLLATNPNLLADSKALGIPVFTYALGADRPHAEALRQEARRSGLMPTGAIINGEAKAFCELLTR